MDKFINKVKSPLSLFSQRKKLINEQSDKLVFNDPVRDLAQKLHPEILYLKIKEIKDETKDMRTFTLVPDGEKTVVLPYFKSGAYLSIKATVEGSPITRAYSICTTGEDAKKGFVKISIKLKKDGFFTPYVFENWKVGTNVVTSDGLGMFGYNEIRDKKNQIGICGGAGVTPMLSMMNDIVQRKLDVSFTLIYGARCFEDVAFKDELEKLEKASNGKIKIVYMLEKGAEKGQECGFITADVIKKYSGDLNNNTYFICGPAAMYHFLNGEFAKLKVPARLIRREVLGEDRSFLMNDPDYAKYNDRIFNLRILRGRDEKVISMKGGESILVALERAGIPMPSQCRSGECGACRIKMLSGYVAINPGSDGRRLADIDNNYIHSCSTYPMSDVVVTISVYETR